MKDLVLGRVNVISEYNEWSVRSPNLEFKIPSVVSLKRHVKSTKETAVLTRYNIFLRDKFICQYCGEKFDLKRLTLDHVLPKSKGGKTTWKNLVSCCHGCNTRKGNKIAGKNFQLPINQPRSPKSAELQRTSRELNLGDVHESWLDYI